MSMLTGPEKDKNHLLVVCENGLGKRTSFKDYRIQNRGGSGIKTCNVTAKTGKIVGVLIFHEDNKNDLLILSKNGQAIRLNPEKIPPRGRATQGVYIMRLKSDDKVASISFIEYTTGEEITEEKKDEPKLL